MNRAKTVVLGHLDFHFHWRFLEGTKTSPLSCIALFPENLSISNARLRPR
jgi:hypothetical protein